MGEYDLAMEDPSLEFILTPPPIHHEDPDSPSTGSILLEPFGYLSDRTNHTTAEGSRRRGKRIMVTFWPASPPRVSCFTVHCPGMKPSEFGSGPMILYTEDDLVLLRVEIRPRDGLYAKNNHRYFVYQAGARDKPPSLKQVRMPPYFRFYEPEIAMLRCRDHDMFFIAVLHWAFMTDSQLYTGNQFHLHVYNSRTGTWSTKLMHVDSPHGFNYNVPSKAITIGGDLGSVGWVDLWRGILICDLLLDNNSLRYIPLPLPLVPKPLRGFPKCVRSIIVVDGYIKYFEMHKDTSIAEGCVAATKKMKISSIGSGDSWEEDITFTFSDVHVSSLKHTQMLPNLQEGEDTEPTLKRICAGYPALSLHDSDVVYIMHKPDPQVHKALVISVDMRNKTVKGVADYGSGRRPLFSEFIYLESGISKHLGVWSSSRFISNVGETIWYGIMGPGKQEVPEEGVHPLPDFKVATNRRRCKNGPQAQAVAS